MFHGAEVSQGKSIGELWREAAWFSLHTALAVLVMLLAIAAFSLTHPDPAAGVPKYIGTLLAFSVPLLGGFIVARVWKNDIGPFVWVSGLLIFAIACVWVIDLPTGPGLCENCLILDRLGRTFFSIHHGSGLLDGQGLMIGTWTPLALVAYAIGAKFGLN